MNNDNNTLVLSHSLVIITLYLLVRYEKFGHHSTPQNLPGPVMYIEVGQTTRISNFLCIVHKKSMCILVFIQNAYDVHNILGNMVGGVNKEGKWQLCTGLSIFAAVSQLKSDCNDIKYDI